MKIAEEFTKKASEIKYPKEESLRFNERIKELHAEIQRITILHKTSLSAKRHAYGEEINKLNKEFKLALFKEYNMETHPKREQIFTKAWEDGHANGYNEVEIIFSDLVDLLIK